jgi:ammonium transporter, Amt family
VIFCPIWMTCVYTVGAFSLWGGGWLATMGAVDFSGGYVIHLAAGTSGFVAAAVIGPRLQADRDSSPPNNLLVALAGAGILWLGWNGFNGGDPYFANANAGAAVLNTNVSTATALLVWTIISVSAWPELVQFLTETECTTAPLHQTSRRCRLRLFGLHGGCHNYNL